MNNMFHRPVSSTKQHGFTLVELLVAMAIFATLMSGILILFVGSIRTVNQGRQSINAHEMARGAQMVFQNDLATGFTARDHADVYNLVGTPVGMVFIGTERGNATSSSNDASVPGVARITYVVYKNNVLNWEPLTPNSTAGTTTLGSVDPIENVFLPDPFSLPTPPLNLPTVSGYPYKLIRFVEPGVSQLDDFPINWDYELPVGVTLKNGTTIVAGYTLRALREDYVAALAASFPVGGVIEAFCTQFGIAYPNENTIRRYLTVEIWLRMLAGGDTVVPVSAWWNENENPMDFATPKAIPLLSATTAPILIYEDNSDLTTRMPFEARDYVLCEGVASPIQFSDKNVDSFYSGANINEAYENQVFSYRSICDSGINVEEVPTWWNVPRVEDIQYIQNIWVTETAPFNDPNPPVPGDADYEAYMAYKKSFMQTQVNSFKARFDRLPVSVSMKLRLALESRTTNAPDFNREFNVEVNIPVGHVRTNQVSPLP